MPISPTDIALISVLRGAEIGQYVLCLPPLLPLSPSAFPQRRGRLHAKHLELRDGTWTWRMGGVEQRQPSVGRH